MATNERPGLLSKVAKFVRNPTKDWSELDLPDQPQESAYDKQALKAMIERKRQNDFVRKREFDQLRKLRNRDPATIASMARPSFFQSSITTDSDGRAVTLKKIDEIEAQMSKQWWKGKQEGASRNADLAARDPRAAPDSQSAMSSQFPTQAPMLGSEHFAPTEAVGLRPNGDVLPHEYAATQLPPGSNAEADAVLAQASGAGPSVLDDDLDFTHSDLYAAPTEDMSTDPELEEAAIRFANGDDAGAEKGLLDSLRTPGAAPELAFSWTAALLDLYRATNNPTQFELAVQEFGARLGKAAPAWAPLGASSPAQPRASAAVARSGASSGELIWQCPATLDKVAMEALRVALSTNPTPWNVGWSRLDTIAVDAMPLLHELFSSLCEEPVALRFAGAEVLVQRLRHMTPSGDRSVDKTWWQLRLDALRAMHLIDEFELAALDYCVTLEVSPPAWREAQCRFETVESAASVTTPSSLTAISVAAVDDASSASELRGEVLGDATRALASLGEVNEVGAQLVVSCRNLVRVDFSAAGGILNWVALRQAEGGQVQFTDVHRLVAAFFIVIGINEHGRVIPRLI
jgi:STAS domain